MKQDECSAPAGAGQYERPSLRRLLRRLARLGNQDDQENEM